MIIILGITACGPSNQTAVDGNMDESIEVSGNVIAPQDGTSFDIHAVFQSITSNTTIQDLERAIGFSGEMRNEVEGLGGSTERTFEWSMDYPLSATLSVVEISGGDFAQQGEVFQARIRGDNDLFSILNLVLSEELAELTHGGGGSRRSESISRDELLSLTGGAEGIPMAFTLLSTDLLADLHLRERGFVNFRWTSDTHTLEARRDIAMHRPPFEDGEEIWVIMEFREVFRFD